MIGRFNSIFERFLYTVNRATGVEDKQVAILKNPTVNYDQLVIQPTTLDYNLYKVVFQVSMTYNSIYTSQAFSYLEVKPSGLVIVSVYGASGGGTYQMAIGVGQTLALDPQKYSFDLDASVDLGKVNFTFYCQVIDNGVAYGYPQLFYNVDLDLLTLDSKYAYSTDIQKLFYANNTERSCFSSVGNDHLTDTYSQ